MIPQSYILEWSHLSPWQAFEHVEQDLIISRALVAIYSDDWLASNLAFRGGTSLHKLYLDPPYRYSEDIDLVQVKGAPIKETILRLQDSISFLGNSRVEQRKDGIRLLFTFQSEFPPVQQLRLKVEINTREHFTVLGLNNRPFIMKSSWFSGKCDITTYRLEELLGTKLRALYQRRKGRDLFDLFIALSNNPQVDINAILACYRKYMEFSVKNPPSKRNFLMNLEAKMEDSFFLGDTTGLLKIDNQYDPKVAFIMIKKELVEQI